VENARLPIYYQESVQVQQRQRFFGEFPDWRADDREFPVATPDTKMVFTLLVGFA